MNNELPKTKINEKTEISYTLKGDYYIPNLALPKQEKITLNKYGRMRLNYLKEYKKSEYTSMLMRGALNAHLKEVQESIQTKVEQLINDLKATANLTEKTKTENQLYWVGTMNAIKQQAEEIAYKEVLYV